MARKLFRWVGSPLGALIWLLSPLTAASQVVPDDTLPQRSRVDGGDRIHRITGGTTAGSNLFHSFSEFSVLTDEAAIFNNAAAIENIITRVTGRSGSTIDGLIRANGGANLFLLNPNGVVVGPNAQLDIGGSFVGSTADSLQFADGAEFSAANPELSLLTVSVPVGLQYGVDPGAIQVSGPGNGLQVDPETFAIVDSDRPSGFQVAPGQTLALVGGSIDFDGGNLTAEDGRIELGAIGGPGQVGLSPDDLGWQVEYAPETQLGPIALRNAASVDASGDRGGNIRLRGSRISLLGGSSALANTTGNGNGIGIEAIATDAIRLTGTSQDAASGEPIFPSSFLSEVSPTGSGTGGSIALSAPRLSVSDGAQVSVSTLGSGDSGNLDVAAQSVFLSGSSDLGFSGLFASVIDSQATGNGGRLTVEADRVQLELGAAISADTFGLGNSGQVILDVGRLQVLSEAEVTAFTSASGQGGELQITAQSITVDGDSLLSTESSDTGNSGSIILDVGQLRVLGGAEITSATAASGQGGEIRINARSVTVDGNFSAIASDASEAEASGDGGDIFIQANRIQLINGGQIVSSTFGQGDAEAAADGGDISIQANRLQVSTGGQITSSTNGTGNAGRLDVEARRVDLTGSDGRLTGLVTVVDFDATGGGNNLTIVADRLRVRDGAQIVVGTAGDGDAGDLVVDVRDVELVGGNDIGASGLIASAVVGSGASGSVLIRGDRLSIRDGATVSASNFSSRNASTPPGRGPAGIIRIQTESVALNNRASVTASTFTGGGGNIDIESDTVVLRRNSAIATDAQGQTDGGNVAIDTRFLIGADNSDITANAVDARGGRVVVSAEGVFGLEARDRMTSQSDITASSERGPAFSGVVRLDVPDVDPTERTAELEDTPEVPQLALGCGLGTVATENRFQILGRGGIRPNPVSSLSPGRPIGDIAPPASWAAVGQLPSEEQAIDTSSRPRGIVEAQGWARGADGAITLLPPEAQRSPGGCG
ncbi:MAG: filamentous hemagglutinin N-terminal domain-containing protein [Elainellaceae cyanobacterium]